MVFIFKVDCLSALTVTVSTRVLSESGTLSTLSIVPRIGFDNLIRDVVVETAPCKDVASL